MIKAIVTDIEGTTSSISFVMDELFPFARRHLADFVVSHQNDPDVVKILADVAKELDATDLSLEQAIQALIQWIDEDRKITPLKTLQGLIWREGYESGELKGHVYGDAVAHLHMWSQAGIKLYVYSSGSVAAQKLLFGYSCEGDLTPLFSGYFDTQIGHKREPDSYSNILNSISFSSEEVLFLSDIKEELDAAAKVGMQTYALNRSGSDQDFSPHPVATNFEQILTEAS